jgi:hypothetical protein
VRPVARLLKWDLKMGDMQRSKFNLEVQTFSCFSKKKSRLICSKNKHIGPAVARPF